MDFAFISFLLIPVCSRRLLGGDLTIVSLRMSTADRRERVLARYGGDSAAADLMDVSLIKQKQKHIIIITTYNYVFSEV